MEPLAVSPAQAAELLGVSKPTIYNLIHAQSFPAFKVGTRTLISTEALRAWVLAQAEKKGDITQ